MDAIQKKSVEEAMYKACIFDLDGTLTDTLDSLTFSVNETLKEIGLPQITEDQCRIFVGNGAKVLIEKALRAGGDTELKHFDEAMAAYRRIFDENCTYHVVPYPGVKEMLAQMRAMGLKLAVLSNKPDRQAVHVVSEIFGEGVFDRVQGQRDGTPRKPRSEERRVGKESREEGAPTHITNEREKTGSVSPRMRPSGHV